MLAGLVIQPQVYKPNGSSLPRNNMNLQSNDHFVRRVCFSSLKFSSEEVIALNTPEFLEQIELQREKLGEAFLGHSKVLVPVLRAVKWYVDNNPDENGWAVLPCKDDLAEALDDLPDAVDDAFKTLITILPDQFRRPESGERYEIHLGNFKENEKVLIAS